MRSVLAVVAVLVTASLGAVIIGEYELKGAIPLVGGLLFGLIVAEVAMAAAGARTALVAALAGSAAGAGLVWAAWISSGHDWSYVPTEAWAGVALAVIGAGLWVRGPRRRAAGSPASP